MSSEKAKMEYLRKALLRWPDKDKVASYNKWVDKTFGSEKEKKERKIDLNNLDRSIKEQQVWYMGKTHEYLQLLIVESKKGTISFKQFTKQDWRNLWSAIFKGSLYFLALASLMGDEDESKEEKVFEDDWTKVMRKFILRYQSDMFLFAGEAPTAQGPQAGGSFLQRIQNPVPSLDILIKLVQFNVDFWPVAVGAGGQLIKNEYGDSSEYLKEWWRPNVGYYKESTPYHLKGEYKFIYDFIGLLPAASALKFANSYRVDHELSKPYLQSLRDKGVEQEIIDNFKEYITEDVSRKDVEDLNKMRDAMITAMKNAAVMDAIEGKESEWVDIFLGKKFFSKTSGVFEGAASMLGQMKDHTLDRAKYDEIMEKNRKLQELQERGMNQSEEAIVRNFYETKGKIDEGTLKFKEINDAFQRYTPLIPDTVPNDSTSAVNKLHVRKKFLPIFNK
jgi:hypothetical protein